MDLLHGRRVLLTGASSGIGATTACALVEAGARVALVARSADKLAELAGSLGDAACALPGDVTDADAMLEIGTRAAEALGGLDGVIANAGVSLFGRVAEGDPADWRRVLDLNLFGAFTTARAALPHFPDDGPRDVLLVGSTASDNPHEHLAVYGASKRGLAAMADSLRLELAPRWIRVCLLEAGATRSSILQNSANQGIEDLSGTAPGRYRALQPSDVAGAIVWALSQPEKVAINRLVVRPNGQLT